MKEAIVEEKCSVHDRSMVGSVSVANSLASSSAGSAPNLYIEVGVHPCLSKYFLVVSFRSRFLGGCLAR